MREGWVSSNLKDITSKIGSGATPKGGQASYKESGISLIRSMNIHDDGFREKNLAFIDAAQAARLDHVKIQEDDLLLNITGASVARCCIVDNTYLPARVNQHVSIIRLKQDIVNPRFLHYSLISKLTKDLLLGIGGQGATRQAITKAQLESFVVSFPRLLTEQKQIVAILDQSFAAIDKAKANIEKNIQNAQELFQSKLNEIFSQKGEDWEEKLLPELATESCSLSYGIVQPGDDYQDGLPVVRPTDMKNTFINIDDLKRIDPSKAESYKRTTLTGHELLLCVRGDTGVVSLTTKELKGANVTRGIVPILFDNNLVRLNFGYYQFISEDLSKQIKEKTYGAALMQINIRDVKQLRLNTPPINVQDELLPKLNTLSDNTESLLSSYSNKLNSLEELKKSILQKAFAGELTEREVELSIAAEPEVLYGNHPPS